MFVHPQRLFKEVEKLCKKYDVLLICDEVAVGFGRTGRCLHAIMKMFNRILCVYKAITGGYLPLAATLTSQKIYNASLSDSHGVNTFFMVIHTPEIKSFVRLPLENIRLYEM
ncbi:aminotransferase class III-fold pyridoxal phosphate-dependent enzyme [Staphylococcus aureus]